jgi:hypothetical protein
VLPSVSGNIAAAQQHIARRERGRVGRAVGRTRSDEGSRYESENLTFAGFVPGAGMGAYLLIDGDKIYFLGKWLESDYEKDYSFVTNDAKYKDEFPAEMFKDAGK